MARETKLLEGEFAVLLHIGFFEHLVDLVFRKAHTKFLVDGREIVGHNVSMALLVECLERRAHTVEGFLQFHDEAHKSISILSAILSAVAKTNRSLRELQQDASERASDEERLAHMLYN